MHLCHHGRIIRQATTYPCPLLGSFQDIKVSSKMQSVKDDTGTVKSPATYGGDKLNQVDFRWFIVRSLPHQERKLADLLMKHQAEEKNILEVYCPTHTTVSVSRGGRELQAPLFAGYVFVLSTQKAVAEFVSRCYPEGTILYDNRRKDGGKPGFLVIPEEQMRFFRDFNENYADKVIILERPYSDYAFNPKTNEPNDVVRVVDGPLAGKEGYLTRFRRDKRLVFNMRLPGSGRYCAVSVPNAWNLHVVRVHNAGGDKQAMGTAKERAVDLLVGIIQGCGYGDGTLEMLHGLVKELTVKPSLVDLCKSLCKRGHEKLGQRIAGLGTEDAELILNLIRYERDNTGYVEATFSKLVIRPYLTPTPGVEMGKGNDEAELSHGHFTEIIRKVGIAEPTYYPERQKAELVTTTYYAHIGIMPSPGGSGMGQGFVLFANWDAFLGEYFMTGGRANEKLVEGTAKKNLGEESGGRDREMLVESFRNYAPTLYGVLTDATSAVRAVRNFMVGTETLNVLAIETTGKETAEVDKAKDKLVDTCTRICREISSTVHLAVWRRYLRTVWLHR